MRFRYLFVPLVVLFITCSEDDNRPPTHFDIAVDSLTATSGKIFWQAPVDPEGEEVFFDIYLEGQLVRSQTDASFRFTGLSTNTTYSGEVIAFDRSHNKTSSPFSFKTYSEVVFSESFDNSNQWVINVQKNAADTRTRAEFLPHELQLIAGSEDHYTFYAARVTAKKTINDLSLVGFKLVHEIKIQLEFNGFSTRTLTSPGHHELRIKFGPYTIYRRAEQPHAFVPSVSIFTFTTSIPKNDLYKATTVEDLLYNGGGKFSGPITSHNGEFEISSVDFNANPIVEFSAGTINEDGAGGGYPAYSNTLVIKSITIKVTGELAP